MSIDKRSRQYVKAARAGYVEQRQVRVGGKKKLDKPWAIWRGLPTQRGAYVTKRMRTFGEAEAWVARYARSVSAEAASGFHIVGPV